MPFVKEGRAVEKLLTLALELGFDHAALLDASKLRALPEVREMCASGRCRRYGKSWSCPPACGTLEECARRMRSYTGGVLVQTTAQLADEFDIETMTRAQEEHKARFFTLARQTRLLLPDCLPLTAGSCTLCRSCTCPARPCRFPKKMLSSMEAYGLLVSAVCKDAGLPYYYGPGTLTYSSCILIL
jgi:predicted metal-binding protein